MANTNTTHTKRKTACKIIIIGDMNKILKNDLTLEDYNFAIFITSKFLGLMASCLVPKIKLKFTLESKYEVKIGY